MSNICINRCAGTKNELYLAAEVFGTQTHSFEKSNAAEFLPPRLTSLQAILFLVVMSWAKWTFPNEPLGTRPEPGFLYVSFHGNKSTSMLILYRPLLTAMSFCKDKVKVQKKRKERSIQQLPHTLVMVTQSPTLFRRTPISCGGCCTGAVCMLDRRLTKDSRFGTVPYWTPLTPSE